MLTTSGLKFSNNFDIKNSKIQFEKQKARRLVKRYRRIKKHPKPPVWFPSGPLVQQTLPVHYIYVFYKRFRLPRDRFIRRRLRRVKEGVAVGTNQVQSPFSEFTLRRRLKPRRRYHRKRSSKLGEFATARRSPFVSSSTDRIRPISISKSNQQIQDFNFGKLQLERRQKLLKTKDQNYNVRVRQLRRRIQRQVLRPLGWRYRPRAGGFVWPGDYLRLESIKAPQLSIKKLEALPEESKPGKISKRKKKRAIQEWQIQPKKYLLKKHNLNVLKKRLEKSQNSSQLNQKIEQLKFLFASNN